MKGEINMPKMRKIEMYINFTNRTWVTEMIEIPADTPERDVEQTAINYMIRKLSDGGDGQIVAFVGVYHIPSIEEDEDA
jgi:hypothetical protein